MFAPKLFRMMMCAAIALAGAAYAQDAPLKKVGFTELPGYEGDFDHIYADLAGKRLILAAEDHGSLELFNLDDLKHVKTIAGVETPHAFLALPEKNLLIVTDSGKGGTKKFDFKTLKPLGALKAVGPGADSMEYDKASGHAFINTGGKDAEMTEAFLEELDPVAGKQLAKIKFASNSLQGLTLSPDGKSVYVMDQGNNKLVTIDRATRKVTSAWPVEGVGQAAMIQFDAAHRRIFVGTRKPGKLIVFDADSGAQVATLAGPEKCDQLIYDAGSQRIYMLGGDGNIVVFRQNDANSYAELARVPSAEGAKTGLLVPELHRLFVAVSPGEGKKSGGGILAFSVE
jgi:YVTN family beta-propeller protein